MMHLNHTPNELAEMYARQQLQVKKLACESIVIHGQCNIKTQDRFRRSLEDCWAGTLDLDGVWG